MQIKIVLWGPWTILTRPRHNKSQHISDICSRKPELWLSDKRIYSAISGPLVVMKVQGIPAIGCLFYHCSAAHNGSILQIILAMHIF